VRNYRTLPVAPHPLYENTNPCPLPGPGGHLDLTDCRFEQLSESAVKVTGSRFVPAERYTIKLEGAKCIGFRTVSIAGTRDPVMIERIDEITAGVRERVADNFRDNGWDYHLNFILYGRDGVMAAMEPTPETSCAHELGVVIEAVADSQSKADTICAFARSTMLHYGYAGRRATAGNLAFPYSPSDFHAGEVYAFSVYHLLATEDPVSLFPTDIVEL